MSIHIPLFNSDKDWAKSRNGLLPHLAEDLHNLAEEFRADQAKVDPDLIDRLIGHLQQLKETNRQLEKKKEQLEKREKPYKAIKKITLTAIGIQFCSVFLAFGADIANLVLSDAKSEKGVNGGSLAVAFIATIITLVIVPGIIYIDDDRDRYKMLSKISRIEQMHEELHEAFLNNFKSYSERREEERFKSCMDALRKIPAEDSSSIFPPSEQWVSMMIIMLPDSSPLKQKFFEVEKKADDLEKKRGKEPFAGEQASLAKLENPDLKQKGKRGEHESDRAEYAVEWTQLQQQIGIPVRYLMINNKKIDFQGVLSEPISDRFGSDENV